ncbi:hypothetical protein U9M48_017240 [Paspalum notatum var. saurae]|uniref:Uncharacterized protein n=1 Tax=Paspalum notatum var. saurae TaxID=547442 RepID=A0AAQ3T849_PASNO
MTSDTSDITDERGLRGGQEAMLDLRVGHLALKVHSVRKKQAAMVYSMSGRDRALYLSSVTIGEASHRDFLTAIRRGIMGRDNSVEHLESVVLRTRDSVRHDCGRSEVAIGLQEETHQPLTSAAPCCAATTGMEVLDVPTFQNTTSGAANPSALNSVRMRWYSVSHDAAEPAHPAKSMSLSTNTLFTIMSLRSLAATAMLRILPNTACRLAPFLRAPRAATSGCSFSLRLAPCSLCSRCVSSKLRDQEPQRHGGRDRRVRGRTGEPAHRDAVVQPALSGEREHHAAPLEVRRLVVLPLESRRDHLVRQHRARRHPCVARAHLVEEARHAGLVALLEHLLVLAHRHGRHALVRQVVPLARAHVHLRELEHLAQRHQHLAAEAVPDAVGVVPVGEAEVLLARLAREDAAGDGLTQQGRAVVGRAERRAPLGREPDLGGVPGVQVFDVGFQHPGERVGDAVVEVAEGLIGGVACEGHLRELRLLVEPLLGSVVRPVDAAAALHAAALVLVVVVAGAVEDAVEDLGEVLEASEPDEVGEVGGEGERVARVHPERGGVEAVPVGLAEAADASEMADELEGRARVSGPGHVEERGEVGVRGDAGDDLVEEVDAGIPRGGVLERPPVLRGHHHQLRHPSWRRRVFVHG